MKKSYYFFLISVLTLTLGCNGNKEKTATITITEGMSITTMKEGGEYSVLFTSDADWKTVLSKDAETWIEINPATGEAGECSITVNIAPFTSSDANEVRKAEIAISSLDGTASVIVEVEQIAKGGLSSESLDFPVEGGEQNLSIYTKTLMNFEYNDGVHFINESDGEWIEITLITEPKECPGKYVYSIKVKKNSTGENRTSSLSACFDGSCKSITINQKG